jgi:tetratricopeptide (TPR) repeat protein
MGAYVSAVAETTRGRTVAAAAGSNGEAVQAELLAYAAKIRTRQSRYEQARRTGLAAAALAEACGEQAALASAYDALLVAEVQLGRDEEAADYARRAYEIYEALGDLEQQAIVANNLGMIAYYGNRWDEALGWYRQSAERDIALGRTLSAGISEANIGEVLLNQGRLDEAEPILRRAVRVLRASDEAGTPFAEMHLARLFTARREFDDAEQLLRAVSERYRSVGSAASMYEATIHLADCLVRSDRAQEAYGELTKRHDARPAEIAIFEGAACLVEGAALVALGRNDEALRTLQRGIEASRAQGLTFDLSRLLLLAAQIAPSVDAGFPTAESVEEAHQLLDRLGVVNVATSLPSPGL